MTNQFNTYRLTYYSAPQYNWEVLVDLFNEGTWAGRLVFMKSVSAVPENAMQGKVAIINYPIGCFSDIMSILRREKPLFATVDPSTGIGYISTSDEPVGELETIAA